MKDKWMNMGYEEDELKPYLEPEPDYKDLKRIGMCKLLFLFACLFPICTQPVCFALYFYPNELALVVLC